MVSNKMARMCVINYVKPSHILYDLGSISPTCLSAAFTHTDPKRAKKTVKSSSFLRFWDLHAQKLRINTLMKLTPEGKQEGKHFENMERTYILQISVTQSPNHNPFFTTTLNFRVEDQRLKSNHIISGVSNSNTLQTGHMRPIRGSNKAHKDQEKLRLFFLSRYFAHFFNILNFV